MKESKKITKFVNQFMMMAECFSSEVKRKRGNIKERLKVAWKWIKGVVKEWNELLKDREVIDDFI